MFQTVMVIHVSLLIIFGHWVVDNKLKIKKLKEIVFFFVFTTFEQDFPDPVDNMNDYCPPETTKIIINWVNLLAYDYMNFKWKRKIFLCKKNEKTISPKYIYMCCWDAQNFIQMTFLFSFFKTYFFFYHCSCHTKR